MSEGPSVEPETTFSWGTTGLGVGLGVQSEGPDFSASKDFRD